MRLLKYIAEGWPQYKDVDPTVRSFYTFKDFLSVVQGIVFYNSRVFIPELERQSVLASVHKGHQGETKCIRRAVELVWWPGMTTEIRELVKTCPECAEFRRRPREPLMCAELPERPWWRLAVDIMEKESRSYLVVVDYFSRFITVHELVDSTSSEVIVKILQKLFCLIGVPNSVMSDNSPQFSSESFKRFMRKWDIQHVTSSPRYPQSNGKAERAVQTVKALMNKNVSLDAALCSYRDTPLANGYSPAQLLYRTKAQESVPIGQDVAIQDPGKEPVRARVLAAQGREVVAIGQSQRLWRRNRHLTRPCRDSEASVPGVVAPRGENSSPQSESGVVAPAVQAEFSTGVDVEVPAVPDSRQVPTIAEPEPLTGHDSGTTERWSEESQRRFEVQPCDRRASPTVTRRVTTRSGRAEEREQLLSRQRGERPRRSSGREKDGVRDGDRDAESLELFSFIDVWHVEWLALSPYNNVIFCKLDISKEMRVKEYALRKEVRALRVQNSDVESSIRNNIIQTKNEKGNGLQPGLPTLEWGKE
ncbi:uncharacterized protein [Watersipora subatra]|uniref:uncharacterized protein n=1 Tax=Watersipora subatra TaxID=2589382 RepID=UPI00355BC40D